MYGLQVEKLEQNEGKTHTRAILFGKIILWGAEGKRGGGDNAKRRFGKYSKRVIARHSYRANKV